MALSLNDILPPPQSSAGLESLISRQGLDPYAFGHATAERLRQQGAGGQSSELRLILAQRLMEHEAELERLRQLKEVRNTVGAYAAAGATGLPQTNFAASRDPVDFAQLQANAQKTASEAAYQGAQAGVRPEQSTLFSRVVGFQPQKMTPLSVQTAAAGNSGSGGSQLKASLLPTLVSPLLGGGELRTPLYPGMADDLVGNAIQAARGPQISGYDSSIPAGASPQQANRVNKTIEVLKNSAISQGKQVSVRSNSDGSITVLVGDEEAATFDRDGRAQ